MPPKQDPAQQVLSPVAWRILRGAAGTGWFDRTQAAGFNRPGSPPSLTYLNTADQYLKPLVALGLLEAKRKPRVQYRITQVGRALVAGRALSVAGAPIAEGALVMVGAAETVRALEGAGQSLPDALREQIHLLRVGAASLVTPPPK